MFRNLILLLILLPTIVFSQDKKKCGTQIKLEDNLKKNPDSRINFLKFINKNDLKNSKSNYPIIPKYTPSGNLSQDQINFKKAKAELSSKNIDQYIKLSRKHLFKEKNYNNGIKLNQFIKK